MRYWLLKSEPSAYSWDQLVKDGGTHWNGVRNFQAANNLKAMKKGDRAFFYHSNEGLAVVGIVEIAKEAYPDPSNPQKIWPSFPIRYATRRQDAGLPPKPGVGASGPPPVGGPPATGF